MCYWFSGPTMCKQLCKINQGILEIHISTFWELTTPERRWSRQTKTGRPRLIALHFIVLHRHCIFYKWKVCDSPSWGKSVGAIFQQAQMIVSNKLSLIKVCTLMRQNAIDCTLNRLQYSVNLTFICTRKPKTLCGLLYCYILFIGLVWNRTHILRYAYN